METLYGRPLSSGRPCESRPSGVRELRDGGVLVGDAGANALFLLSSDFRTMQPVEKRHTSVTALFAAPAGGATLFDLDGARLIGIDDSGRVGRIDTVPPAVIGSRALPLEILHLDAQRRAYFVGARANPRANTGRDSVPLLRKRLDQEGVDTITWLRTPVAIMEPPTQARQPPVIRVPTALVFDAAGKPRYTVVLANDARVVGFSDTAMYASIRSTNGKTRLARHQRPW